MKFGEIHIKSPYAQIDCDYPQNFTQISPKVAEILPKIHQIYPPMTSYHNIDQR